MSFDIFNAWKPFPKNKPQKNGWYICTCRFLFDETKREYQSYVMDLYWDSDTETWKDNRRLNVFQTYQVYGWGNNGKKQLYSDNNCYRTDVIAFKNVPKVYKVK